LQDIQNYATIDEKEAKMSENNDSIVHNTSDGVVIFTTPFCGICHSLMDWMDKSEIKYTEKNLEDAKTREEAEKLVGREVSSVPVTIIGGEIIEGFDRKAILKAIGR
jgi:glutaredoxin